MAKALLAAFASAAIFAAGAFGSPAAAMTPAALSTLGTAHTSAPALVRVAVVCGMNGCAAVHVLRVRRPPPGFVTRAAPLVFPVANPVQSAPQNGSENK